VANAGELLDRWLHSFNHAQWEEGERLFAPNGVVDEIGMGRTSGADHWSDVGRDWRAAFSDAQGVIVNRIVSGDQAVGEIVWSGTNDGPFNGIPPTNKRIRVRSVAIVTEEGGQLALLRHYLDVAGLLTQLGALPGRPGG
jgi:steroid delta-isomerase-like uncharacterized protein